MRQSLKIAISLLASLLLFAGFAVLGFSGLFDVLQTSFFLPRIEQVYQDNLDRLVSRIDRFHQANLEIFSNAAKKDFIAASFDLRLSDPTLKAWADAKSQIGFFGVRLLGADAKRILYSSFLDMDVKQQLTGGVSYRNYNEDNTSIPVTAFPAAPDQKPKVLIDGPHGWFVYALPAQAPAKANSPPQFGTLLFYVSQQKLLSELTVTPGVPVEKVALVGSAGVLINFDPAGSKAVEDDLVAIWNSNPGSSSFTAPLTLSSQGGPQAAYRVFSQRLAAGGMAGLVEPSSLFEMADLMKGLLLATFFLTVFLFLYLIFNLRTDPLDVLRQRVKRFQIQLITELVESPGGADWNKWRGEMESRKDEITWQIQRGIGRVSKKQKPIIDEYLSKSWSEILDLVSRRAEAPAAAAAGAIDISRLESLIQAALKNANFILPEQKVSPARALQVEEIRAEEVSESAEPGARRAKPAPAAVSQSAAAEEVEEAEAVEEIEEVQEAETIDEAEVVEEAEAVEEVETIDEAETVEEAEVVEEAEAVEEAETVEEAAAVEEAEEAAPVEEAAAVEEYETIEEVETVEDAETAEAEPAEPAEALPEPEGVAAEARSVTGAASDASGRLSPPQAVPEGLEEEPAELEPMEDEAEVAAVSAPQKPEARKKGGAVTDFVEIRVPGEAVDMFSDLALALEAEAIDTSGELLEELEPLPEVRPLPPEPVEEGLELLPVVDEERHDDSHGHGSMASGRIEALESRTVEPEEYEERARIEAPPPEPLIQPEVLVEAEDLVEPERGRPTPVEPAELAFEEVVDFEELESVEEEAVESVEEVAVVPSAADTPQALDALLASGAIKIWTVEELQRFLEEGKSAIVMEDGLFRIKEEVYTAGNKPSENRDDEKLRQIVEEVVKHEMEGELSEVSGGQPAEAESGLSGIGDLISAEDTLDLSDDFLRDQAAAEEAPPAQAETASPIRLKRNGLDYDEFLSSYPRSFTHTTQMKTLVELSRRVSAVSAGLFIKKVQTYALDLTVGMSERTVRTLAFSAGEPAFKSLFAPRKYFAVNKNSADVAFLRVKIDPDDLRYMKRVLLFPANFRGQEAYLLLGFAGETEIVISQILAKLVVR